MSGWDLFSQYVADPAGVFGGGQSDAFQELTGIAGMGPKSAAALQFQASQNALNFQKDQWAQSRADVMPWLTAGGGSVNALAEMTGPGGSLRDRFTMADFQSDPGYRWRQEQGQNALAAQAAAAGNYGSGNMGTALLNYSQNLASDEYQNAYNRWNNDQNQLYNRLANLAGLGQVSSGQLLTAGQNAATAMGNASMAGANALAAGKTNLWNQGMGALGAYLNYRQAQAATSSGGYDTGTSGGGNGLAGIIGAVAGYFA